MIELRISFSNGTEHVLFRHDDAIAMADIFNSMLKICHRALDPEERFQLGLVREIDDRLEVGLVLCGVDGKVEGIQWMAPDARFGRTPTEDGKTALRGQLDKLASLLLAAQQMSPDMVDALRRLI